MHSLGLIRQSARFSFISLSALLFRPLRQCRLRDKTLPNVIGTELTTRVGYVDRLRDAHPHMWSSVAAEY